MANYIQMMRKFVGTRRIFLPGVRAIILNEKEEILLQKRTDMNLWGIIAGGVELGETALEAIQREVKEETTLDIHHAEPMALYSGAKQQFTYPNGDQVQPFSVAFIVREWSGVPRPDGVEGSELRFFSRSQVPEDLVPIHKLTLADFDRYNGKFLLP